MIPKVLIYHTALSEDSTPDDLDVKEEVKFVSENLSKLGYEIQKLPFNLKILENGEYLDKNIIKEIKEINPFFIFNLVEGVNGKDSLAKFAPLIFEKMHVPYTGCTYSAFDKTESKTKTKRILYDEHLPTPYWITLKNNTIEHISEDEIKGKKFIIKSRTEHASKGLESTLFEKKNEIESSLFSKGKHFFAEEYIDGREFNVSIIGSLKHGNVLPIPEMKFEEWPEGKPKIADYSSKWDENSEEYNKTGRSFEFSDIDKPLLKRLEQICIKSWKVFDLRGYARVDFRVDNKKRPYVLEINTNPCISPDAGFVAASHKAGMTNEQIIQDIIKNSCGEKFVL